MRVTILPLILDRCKAGPRLLICGLYLDRVTLKPTNTIPVTTSANSCLSYNTKGPTFARLKLFPFVLSFHVVFR